LPGHHRQRTVWRARALGHPCRQPCLVFHRRDMDSDLHRDLLGSTSGADAMSRNAALWTGVLAGPIIWLLSFEANFALAPWACIFQAKLALYIVSILALVLAA